MLINRWKATHETIEKKNTRNEENILLSFKHNDNRNNVETSFIIRPNRQKVQFINEKYIEINIHLFIFLFIYSLRIIHIYIYLDGIILTNLSVYVWDSVISE